MRYLVIGFILWILARGRFSIYKDLAYNAAPKKPTTDKPK